MNKYFIFGSVVLLLFVFAGFAFAEPDRDRDREGRKGKVIIGTIESIDVNSGTLVVKAEKYVVRGEGEVAANGEKVNLKIGERTKCGLKMDRAELNDLKAGMKVVVVSIERDGTLYAVAVSDPETAQMMRDKMENYRKGEGRGEGRERGMRGGGRGRGMGFDGHGMGPNGEGRGRGRGIPLYGEVTSVSGNTVTVMIREFPVEQLEIPAFEGKPHFGKEFKNKVAEMFPNGVTIELTNDTKVMLNGSEVDPISIKVGSVLMFRCVPPEGQWSKENQPDRFIAKVVVDIETIKKHIGDRRNAPRGGRQGV